MVFLFLVTSNKRIYHEMKTGRGVARILHWGATEAEHRRCEYRGGLGLERGCPPPQPN